MGLRVEEEGVGKQVGVQMEEEELESRWECDASGGGGCGEQVGVRVEEEVARTGERFHCCSAYLTFVAVLAKPSARGPPPRRLPRVVPNTPYLQEIWESADRCPPPRLLAPSFGSALEWNGMEWNQEDGSIGTRSASGRLGLSGPAPNQGGRSLGTRSESFVCLPSFFLSRWGCLSV